ncbi:MAG TPA: hypothetical protein VHK69_06700 [Chitinophagaceae bacterium]|jgi:outer membrane lipoprotein-sorting protein|nr:hypothetical protein [Chitinophagaceae bacterium]
MKRSTFIYLLLLLLTALPALAQDEAALLQRVKARLNRVNDYTATGNMKLDVSFIKAPPSQVKVYYKKPSRFKVEKAGGISILPKGGVSVNLNALLLTDNYTAVPAGTATIGSITTKVIKLLPNDENGDVVLTTLYIDEKEALIRRTKVTTRESGTYEMDLSYGAYAAWGLPDKVVFSFNTKDYKLPKGITFEYEKGGPQKQAPAGDKKGKVEITYASYVINKGVEDKVFAGK